MSGEQYSANTRKIAMDLDVEDRRKLAEQLVKLLDPNTAI